MVRVRRYRLERGILIMSYFETETARRIKQGEFVRKLNKDGTMQKKTYVRREYNRETKKFILQDWEDANHYIEVKASTPLAIGFTF